MAAALRPVRLSARDEETATSFTASAPLVLVVEDHDDTRFLLRYMLEARGYRVAEAENGEEAVALIERIHPDFVFMDGSLPRLDGLAATRLMRRLPSAVRVPIIFVSGHDEPAFRAAAREAGCDDYLTKPFRIEQLENVLRRHACGRASAEV